MGLAERFKTKLEKKNIFEKDIIEQKLEENDIKFISKPEMIDLKNSTIQTPIIVNTDLNVSENQEEKMLSPDKLFLEDLENELINKIRKTPYYGSSLPYQVSDSFTIQCTFQHSHVPTFIQRTHYRIRYR